MTIEWTGSLLGLLGAFLLAFNTQISGWGFVAFLVSNLFWVAFAFERKASEAGFTARNVLGIVRWL